MQTERRTVMTPTWLTCSWQMDQISFDRGSGQGGHISQGDDSSQ